MAIFHAISRTLEIFSNHELNQETLGKGRILAFFKLLRDAKERDVEFTEGSEPYPADAEKRYTFPVPQANRVDIYAHPCTATRNPIQTKICG